MRSAWDFDRLIGRSSFSSSVCGWPVSDGWARFGRGRARAHERPLAGDEGVAGRTRPGVLATILALAAVVGVDAAAAAQVVVAVAAVEGVVVGAAAEDIGQGAADQQVVAGAAVQVVLAGRRRIAAEDGMTVAEEGVVAVAAVEFVV